MKAIGFVLVFFVSPFSFDFTLKLLKLSTVAVLSVTAEAMATLTFLNPRYVVEGDFSTPDGERCEYPDMSSFTCKETMGNEGEFTAHVSSGGSVKVANLANRAIAWVKLEGVEDLTVNIESISRREKVAVISLRTF